MNIIAVEVLKYDEKKPTTLVSVYDLSDAWYWAQKTMKEYLAFAITTYRTIYRL
jgi:hypothetical protein